MLYEGNKQSERAYLEELIVSGLSLELLGVLDGGIEGRHGCCFECMAVIVIIAIVVGSQEDGWMS